METVTTEKKFLEKEELNKLSEIQEKTKQLIFELGEIEMIKLQLDNRRKQSESFLEEISIEEGEFSKTLSEKYGPVNIDPKNGEITKLD
tara:strand:- start:345 stop:611 length:267 start_codon:yes stop_codon:yes gene_type:complete